MKSVTRSTLPIPNSGCGSIRVTSNSVRLTVEFEYDSVSDGPQIGALEFHGVIANRFRSEMYSVGFPQDSFDTLVEIIDSDWRDEVFESGSKLSREGPEAFHHFAVFLSNNGLVEVLAKSHDGPHSRSGRLKEIVNYTT